MGLEKKLIPPVDSSSTDLKDALKRFAPVLERYYESFDRVQPKTAREKILALQIKVGRGQFHTYGGGETTKMQLAALEYVYLVQEGFIK